MRLEIDQQERRISENPEEIAQMRQIINGKIGYISQSIERIAQTAHLVELLAVGYRLIKISKF
ncbi:hypothetical protein [Halobacillus sp. BBL2006]|uniref:hypothetical protein n=1 Tax=Halobacillus sp. BBL2006 TaxID=1543706 RepID=UPI000AD8E0BE|nr:hypothetical protein [Halobacillus sp. BBL2006]